MANYVLTQTGQEVQDILDSMGATYFFSQTATFASDNTYADYPYKGTISLVGVDGTMGVEVTFSNDQAISGNYSPICNTTNDAVEIWSKVNTSITIPTIKIYKNGYVNLNGSSNYMPQSGGNFTGAVTINNNPIVTNATWVFNGFTLTDTTDFGVEAQVLYRMGNMRMLQLRLNTLTNKAVGFYNIGTIANTSDRPRYEASGYIGRHDSGMSGTGNLIVQADGIVGYGIGTATASGVILSSTVVWFT